MDFYAVKQMFPTRSQILSHSVDPRLGSEWYLQQLRGTLKNSHSKFKDIIQIEVNPPPSHPIFDKFIFDTVFIMLTSLPPLTFLTKIIKFQALKLTFSIIPITFLGSGLHAESHRIP